ncbi:redoxin domain-containing protein [Sulfuritalea sp.]|uniref:redoxin domain-containing protein n=1 Tax=Sulfuritalea sp. TaxID=2480090 RepID=UPI001ACE013A|nr:redoxin domain-containing protein [Sulfuritalea sp.]MBN8477270.1 redoxin domain-containing protein [Sulfuritalea sp.]
MNFSSRIQTLLPTKRWQRWLLEAALILAVILGAQHWQTRGLPEGAAPPLAGVLTDGSQIKVGAPQGLPSVAGETANGAPTLVAFWATWCPVCTAEEDNIVAVAKEHRVISVAMQSGDAAAVIKHLQERGIELPALVDADGRHAQNWRVRGVPTHFVVDGAGNIRFRVVGYATTWGLKARLWWAENVAA